MDWLELLTQVPIFEVLVHYLDYKERACLLLLNKKTNTFIKKNNLFISQIFKKPLKYAIKTHSFSLLTYCYDNRDKFAGEQFWYAMEWAALYAPVDFMIYIKEKCKYFNEAEVMNNAIYSGDLKKVIWMHDHYKPRFRKYIINEIAAHGYLDVIIWLRKNTTADITNEAIDNAASYGHFDTLKWLCENTTVRCSSGAMDWAARHGHLDIFKWLHTNIGAKCQKPCLTYLARNGHPEYLEWAEENGVIYDSDED